MSTLDDQTILQHRGIRPTRQRRRVYSALFACSTHPTAEELHRLIVERAAVRRDSISLATVYNALHALETKGLCRSIPTVEGTRWDADTDEHVHVRVAGTAEVFDLPEELGRKLLEQVPRALLDEIGARLGLEIEGVSMHIKARARGDGGVAS
ncbi:MAG: transcriptional repressor [Phycisphaerales bacterium]